MSTISGSDRIAQATPAQGGSGSATVSAEEMQRLVDQAAYFNLHSRPAEPCSNAVIHGGVGPIGLNVREVLHRFDVAMRAPAPNAPFRAANRVGEPIGRFSHQWLMIPDGFAATPNSVPPPTRLDPSRSQRFVMLNGTCTFGDGTDGFRGFGTGTTFPSQAGQKPQLFVTAIGTILQGFGRFEGHEEATYVYCGTLAPARGFTGNLMLRAMDSRASLVSQIPIPAMRSGSAAEPGITYVVLRGEAIPSDPVSPNLGPDGKPIGLIVEQGLKLQHLDVLVRPGKGICTASRVGQRIGRITAYVAFNPAAASGTALDPVPFTAYDEFVLYDQSGQTVGGFTADSSEGRVFNTKLAGLPAIRFGGVGHLRDGTGPFEGIGGLMTDNSVVVFGPHVSASVYVLRIHDPRGKFRAALDAR